MSQAGIKDTKVLYLREDNSDKVWGYFELAAYVDEDPQIRHALVRFWGKRTAAKLSLSSIPTLTEAENLWRKKVDKGYNIADGKSSPASFQREVFVGVNRTLKHMLDMGDMIIDNKVWNAKAPAPISVITKVEMKDGEIRPSQVYFTTDSKDGNETRFYDKSRELLGTRPKALREKIFAHLRKTKTPMWEEDEDLGDLIRWD